MFDVRAHFGKWILVGAMAAAPVGAEVIFEENFDDQPDWHGAMYTTNTTQWADEGAIIPRNWDAVRHDPAWSPSRGYPDGNEAMEILAANLEMARGGEGKALVLRRYGYTDTWNGDGQLVKELNDLDEVYVSFWIRFQPDWTNSGSSKIFRIVSSPETRSSAFWSYVNVGFVWSYSHNSFGVRNKLSWYSEPSGWSNPSLPYLHASMQNNDISGNYTSNTYDFNGDGVVDNDPRLLDRISGDSIPNTALKINSDYLANHENVFGSEWNRVEFYVRTNSGPGVADGVFMQWLNGSLILKNDSVPWTQTGSEKLYKWNSVKFGGNDYFVDYPDEMRVIEWYAIDDIVIRSSLPSDRVGYLSDKQPPVPPGDVVIN